MSAPCRTGDVAKVGAYHTRKRPLKVVDVQFPHVCGELGGKNTRTGRGCRGRETRVTRDACPKNLKARIDG